MSSLDPANERDALRLLREVLDAGPQERDELLGSIAAPALAARVRELLARVDAREAEPEVALHQEASGAGERVGPYRLIERIGRGGMGEVFRAARDDGAFDRDVALKRIWGGFAPLTGRFLRERQVLARLQHPGIAQLFDGGITEAGQPWFAMELVRGEAITHWCDARGATLEQRVELVRQVCTAVDFAHRALIVHRDLKPANVLVDESGTVKLLDFGIAKLLDDTDAQQTQTLAMTPAWAAPEQRDGRPVTTAADVWQLGMLLRVLLADDLPTIGHAPLRLAAAFEALRRDDERRAEVVAAARSTTPDRLQARIRGDLEAIVAQATAIDANERYRSAAALADDLARWCDGLPVQARRDERGYRIRRALKRHALLAAGVAVVVVLSVGFAFYHVRALQAELARTQEARKEAESARSQAERERVIAQATSEFLLSVFRGATPGEVAEGDLTVLELLDRARSRLKTSQDPAPVRGPMLTQLGRIYIDQSMLVDADDVLAEAVRVLRAPDVPPGTLAEALRSWSEALARRGQLRESLAATREAVKAVERSPQRGSAHHAGLVGNVAIVQHMLGDADGAMRTMREAVTLLRPHAKGAGRTLALQLSNLAGLESDAGEHAVAERHFREALAAYHALRPRDREGELLAERGLALAIHGQGRGEEARRLMREIILDVQTFFGPRHVETVRALHDAATVALDLRDFKSAELEIARARKAMQGNVLAATRKHEAINEALKAVLVIDRDGGDAGRQAIAMYASRWPPGADELADAARLALRCHESAEAMQRHGAMLKAIQGSDAGRWYTPRLARICAEPVAGAGRPG